MNRRISKPEDDGLDLSDWPQESDGKRCAACKTIVPEFSELDGEVEAQLRVLAKTNAVKAMKQLEYITKCNPRWAKIWALHPDGPSITRFNGPPCPHCSVPLPNEKSRQCLTCGEDWHA